MRKKENEERKEEGEDGMRWKGKRKAKKKRRKKN